MSNAYRPSVVVLPRTARLDRLVGVLPLALERYRAGFVITLQAQSHGAVPFVDTAPAATLDLTDDCGGRSVRSSVAAQRARVRGATGNGGSPTVARRRAILRPASSGLRSGHWLGAVPILCGSDSSLCVPCAARGSLPSPFQPITSILAANLHRNYRTLPTPGRGHGGGWRRASWRARRGGRSGRWW